MTVEQMRVHLLSVHPYSESIKWVNKVRSWRDAQVIAVYYKFLAEGRFIKQKHKPEPHQMNLTEFGVNL